MTALGEGVPQLNRSVLTNIENGRRKQGITIEEARVLLDAIGDERRRRLAAWATP